MEPKEFTLEEFEAILEKSQELMRKSYLTGINFLQSEKPLPKEKIVIHFLHNSTKYLEDILLETGVKGEIIPRFGLYKTRPEYFTSQDFIEKYKDAIFIQEGKRISLEEATYIKSNISVINLEQDLLIPYKEKEDLTEAILKLREADNITKGHWIDPVIIVRTKIPFSLQDFGSRDCISLTKEKEEFYTIVFSEEKKKYFLRYIQKLCKKRSLGNLHYEDIVFSLSLVNNEFLSYLEKVFV